MGSHVNRIFGRLAAPSGLHSRCSHHSHLSTLNRIRFESDSLVADSDGAQTEDSQQEILGLPGAAQRVTSLPSPADVIMPPVLQVKEQFSECLGFAAGGCVLVSISFLFFYFSSEYPHIWFFHLSHVPPVHSHRATCHPPVQWVQASGCGSPPGGTARWHRQVAPGEGWRGGRR